MRELFLRQNHTTQRVVTCKNDGSGIDLDATIGCNYSKYLSNIMHQSIFFPTGVLKGFPFGIRQF